MNMQKLKKNHIKTKLSKTTFKASLEWIIVHTYYKTVQLFPIVSPHNKLGKESLKSNIIQGVPKKTGISGIWKQPH